MFWNNKLQVNDKIPPECAKRQLTTSILENLRKAGDAKLDASSSDNLPTQD